MTSGHHHTWVIDDIDDRVGAKDAHMVTLRCTGCPETMKKLTTRTKVEIQRELEAANG